MKKIFSSSVMVILFLLMTGSVLGQKTLIKGVMVDTLGEPLVNATVVLLNPQDSIMEYFGITNIKGNFTIKGVKPGNYVFQASYLGHETYYKNLEMSGAPELQMGLLVLKPEVLGLDEVTVSAERIPIMIKKDTIEYNAGSFKVQPNDNVEQLLKKLPGVEVDKNGTIKAQGKEVQQVMVDGKDFFGKDPKIASQNLPADAIDKVQVYDKKSDMAEFTGIDDGTRDKTINLKLKEDKKKGIFGKVAAGYGTTERYESKANINRFNKKSQLSFLGRMNNVNQQGFSLNDYLNFAGGLSNLMSSDGGGGMSLSFGGDNGPVPFDYGGANYGFTKTISGGLNFNYDFSKKTEMRSSYFFSNIKKTEDQEIFRQNFLGETTFPSEEIDNQYTKFSNHRGNVHLKHKIDSMQVLNFRSNAVINDGFFDRFKSSQIFNTEQVLENSGWNKDISNGTDWTVNSTLSYMLRFKKKGRAFTTRLGFGISDDDKSATIESENHFLVLDSLLALKRAQIQTEDQKDYSVRATYTEPIGKKQYVQLSYNRQYYNTEAIQEIQNTAGDIPERIDSLSNHYIRDYFYDRAGLTYKLNQKNSTLSAGIQYQYSQLDGDIISDTVLISQSFRRWLPNFRWQYDFATSKNLSVSYRTSLREPSVQQLNPNVNNNNPLSVYKGNPDLAPEFNHNLNVQLMLYDQFSFTSFFASIYATYTEDKITNSRTIDNLFRQTTVPVNVKEDLRLNSSVSFGTPLKPIKSKINISLSGMYNKGILFVNGLENITDRWNTSVDFSLENRKKDIVDILVGVNWSYNQTEYSESKILNQAFSSYTYYADLGLDFKGNWAISSSFDYTLYRGDIFQDQQQIPMWQASVSKSFLKNNRGELKLTAMDLLNQGIGIDRRSNLNYIEDIKINSLGRYLMLTFTYQISAFGSGQQGGIEISTRRRRGRG